MSKPQWMAMADPIHGMIRLRRHYASHQLILDVINSRAFQRLRRIRQMGLAEFVFPGATHSRFMHSIGSAWLMIKTIDHLQQDEGARSLLSQSFADTGIPLEHVLLLSILVHDIGHLPLSHTLEDVLEMKEQHLLHDTYWNKLILQEDAELQQLWDRYHPGLPQAVSQFNGVEDHAPSHFLADLVSSQLDMDRLDYLLRDSHYLGVQYGRIEVERIITNLSIEEAPTGNLVIAIREEALPAVEHYLFGRYQAYKMALHSLDKASETLLKKTLERFKWVRDNGRDPGHPADLIYDLMRDGRCLTVEDYLMLDDCYLWDKINQWARYSTDVVLRQLANRMLGHDLFKFVDIGDRSDELTPEALTLIQQEMEAYYKKHGLPFEFGFDQMTVFPKPLYQPASVKPPIWILRKHGRLSDFSEVSSLPHAPTGTMGRRHLLFTWDRESKDYLRQLLAKKLGLNEV